MLECQYNRIERINPALLAKEDLRYVNTLVLDLRPFITELQHNLEQLGEAIDIDAESLGLLCVDLFSLLHQPPYDFTQSEFTDVVHAHLLAELDNPTLNLRNYVEDCCMRVAINIHDRCADLWGVDLSTQLVDGTYLWRQNGRVGQYQYVLNLLQITHA